MYKSFWDHPVETIEKALHIRKQIEELETKLSEIYVGTPTKADRRRRKRSPSTIGEMAAAEAASWPRKTSLPASTVKPAKKRRTLSAASRAKMAAAQKARWAKQKTFPHTGPGIE
jgi:hypothetical protein